MHLASGSERSSRDLVQRSLHEAGLTVSELPHILLGLALIRCNVVHPVTGQCVTALLHHPNSPDAHMDWRGNVRMLTVSLLPWLRKCHPLLCSRPPFRLRVSMATFLGAGRLQPTHVAHALRSMSRLAFGVATWPRSGASKPYRVASLARAYFATSVRPALLRGLPPLVVHVCTPPTFCVVGREAKDGRRKGRRKFVDRVRVRVIGGRGGRGVVSFESTLKMWGHPSALSSAAVFMWLCVLCGVYPQTWAWATSCVQQVAMAAMAAT